MAKIIDNFILIETLGTGHFSETMKGRNLVSKSPVAVKTIKLDQFLNNQHLREMVINEIQLLKKLEHPNILQMLKMLKSSNNIYLIYEFVNGGKLSQLIGKSLDEGKIFGYLKQMVDVVAVVHKEEIIHNNLSPETFFFNDEQLKLKNFLSARSVSQKKPVEPELWRYAAPEILQGKSPSFKSDVWSLGMVFLELLRGKALIDGPNEREKVLERVLDPSLLDFDDGFSHVLLPLLQKMLALEESDRVSLEEVTKELQALSPALTASEPKEEEDPVKSPISVGNGNKKLEKIFTKERQKVLFLVQNINKVMGLSQWVLDFPRNLLVLALLKTGLLGLESLINILSQSEHNQNASNFMINIAGLDRQEINTWLNSDFALYFTKNLEQERDNLKEVVSKFSCEEAVRSETENLNEWGLEFYRLETEKPEVAEERSIMRVLFSFASRVYEIMSRQKENSSEMSWDEDTKREQGLLANYLLDVVFSKEFFGGFLQNDGRLSEQMYFKYIEGVGIKKLQVTLEKKLAYAKKQLNLL